jgi:hypothetical protein
MDASESHQVLNSRDWAAYSEACVTHDHDEPVVYHAQDLVVECGTISTN